MAERCGNCRFFDTGNVEMNPETNGETIKPHCRRYAPHTLSGSGTGWSGQLFPIVNENGWCGEWVCHEHEWKETEDSSSCVVCKCGDVSFNRF
ncbi:MAG: hypothetical protein WA061_02795 [Microgenomates group bacterium]